MDGGQIPVIDVGPLVAASGAPASRNPTSGDPAPRTPTSGDPALQRVAEEIGAACRESGFFYVVGHGVDAGLQARLEEQSRAFFALGLEEKMRVRMPLAGAAWRGYFPVGDELTSGRPDVKEGLYFGIELPADDPRVVAGLPLHGPNLMPERPAGLGATVLAYTAAMTSLGHALMRGVALSLGLGPRYFEERFTATPTTLFRIFNYPAVDAPGGGERWGVGEHTDYGLLTMLRQDGNAGLEVRSRRGDAWVPAPPVAGSFVCNIGDMLDRLTGGHYRSTPHRVVPSMGRDRISWPFFFDPSWDADVRPVGRGVLAGAASATGGEPSRRWDGVDLAGVTGTYGEYLLGKVGKVFPQLRSQVL